MWPAVLADQVVGKNISLVHLEEMKIGDLMEQRE